MTRALVIHGAGMNMRGKAQVEIFGPDTLDQINDKIRAYAGELGIEVDLFHSNIAGEVINALYDAHDNGVDAALINPAGYTTAGGAITSAVTQVSYPVIEVHASNPASRGVSSNFLPVSKACVYGVGVYGYYLALQAAKHMTGGD